MKYAIGIPIIGGITHVNYEVLEEQYQRLLSVLTMKGLRPITKSSAFNDEAWITVIAAETMNIDEKEGG